MSTRTADKPANRRGAQRALTPEQEQELVRLYSTTRITLRVLAAQFGVSRQTVYNILDRNDPFLPRGSAA